jgi:hypothetical protein
MPSFIRLLFNSDGFRLGDLAQPVVEALLIVVRL